MKPLVDISAALAKFDLKVTEQLKVEAKLLSRDTTNNYFVVLAPPLSEFLTHGDEAKVLPKPDLPAQGRAGRLSPTAEPSLMRIVVPERIGIVKAWDFEGTRVQVEFAFLNDTDHLIAIRDVMLRIGLGRDPGEFARFKQMVDVTPEARVPSVKYRLPVIVPAKSGIWLCAELEGPIDSTLGSRDEDCLLVVGANAEHVSTGFVVHGDAVTGKVLGHIKKTATTQKGAVAFGVPIAAAVIVPIEAT